MLILILILIVIITIIINITSFLTIAASEKTSVVPRILA